MDELSVKLNNVVLGCYVNGQPLNHLFYADDSVLLAPTPEALQKMIHICETFGDDVELVYNTKKTFCMSVFPRWLKGLCTPDITLNGNSLQFVEEHKYLGIILCKDMYDDKAIMQQIKATYARGNVLISRFRKCDEHVKVKLFKTYCNSFYGCNLWIQYHRRTFRKLASAYRRIFRQLFNICDRDLTTTTMINLCVDPVEVIVRKMSGSLYKRIYNSDNTLVISVIESLYFCDSLIFKSWQKNLF